MSKPAQLKEAACNCDSRHKGFVEGRLFDDGYELVPCPNCNRGGSRKPYPDEEPA